MHNIEYRSYDEKVNKDKVMKELDDYVAHEDWQEGCSGLYNGIRWLDVVLGSYDEAQEYIEKHDRGSYDNLAVRYRMADNGILENRKYKELTERIKRLWKEYEDLDGAIYMRNAKSLLVTCSKCGSRISSQHWNRNTCPVCGTDFRSKTTLERIKAKYNAYKKVQGEREQYKSDYAKKHGKLMWLVKFEYHT